MKTKFFKIAWLIFTVIHVVTGHSQISDSTGSDIIVYLEPDTSYPGLVNGIPSRDQLTETVWLSTGLPYAGGIPYDILYVDDETYPPLDSRIFIYTERKLLSYNMFEYYWGITIDLSEFGSQTLFKLTQPLLPRSREKHLAYNPDKYELYCLTQDLKILIIDPRSSIEIIGEIIPDTDINLIDWAIIKYDPVSKYIFIGLCRFHDKPFEAELIAFNTTDYSYEYSINKENLNDFSFNPNPLYPLLYLSSNNEIQVRNTLDGSEVNTYTMPCNMGVIFNAYNGNGLNKTYCLPKSLNISANNALIFDGNNTTPQTISLEKGNFGCGIYNAPSNKVYIGYTNTISLPSGFISFDPDTENMTDHPLDGQDIIMDMANLEERVFISTKDHIYCCKNGSYYPDYTLNSPGSYFYRIAATNYYNDPRIWATNMMDQSLQVAYSPSELSNLEWFEPWLLSGAALQGFFNHADHKLYLYYGMPDGDHKYMYIYDPATENITTVKIDHNPTGVVLDDLDEETNTIYFSTYQNNLIKRYDASSNSWLEPIILPEGYSSCYEMYLSNRMLYCSVKHQSQEGGGTPNILVYDLEGPLTNPVIIPIPGFSASSNIIVSHYTIDEAGRVYVSVRFAFSDNGRVIRINDDFSITDFGINFEHPDEILYDQLHDKILLKYLQTDNISILDFEASPPSFQDLQPRIGLAIIDMEIDPISNLIYFDYNDDEENGYIDIYTTDGTLVKTVLVGYRALALKYNPINGLMYVHVPANSAANRKEQLWSIDPAAFNVYSMDLGQNEGHWRNGYYLTDMILDDENNKIYSVSAHGNIKIIQCSYDQLTLQPRIWNWISFPRLEREGNGSFPADSVLMKITPFPTSLQLLHKDPESQEMWDKTYEIPDWSGELNVVRSSLGYKLETNNPEVSVLPMSGTILSPETTFPLYSHYKTNWTGYFLTRTQSPFDAIGSEFLDQINWIAGQYWFCFKQGPPHTKNSGDIWGCACEQGRIELEYGDMIEIFPSQDIPQFHWQYAGQPSPEDPKEPSLLFQYHEQAEYDALIIELDTMNRPAEIGAFAGDSCIGATTVLPADTTVLICGYTQGYEGQEITFELLYPTKSSKPRCDDYQVLNTQTGIREQRRIVAGEKQPYFLVSFKEKSGQVPLEESSWMTCRPNPADNEVTVSYFINNNTETSFRLINSLGSLVKSWKRGYQRAGAYDFRFGTASFPAGYYQLEMNTGNTINMQKLIILH